VSLPIEQQPQPQPNLYQLGEKLYNLGDFLLWDDRGDIGRGAYYGRKEHVYKGQPSPDHPSPYHHWPIGILLMALGQTIGTLATLNDMKDAVTEDESFNNKQLVDSSRQ